MNMCLALNQSVYSFNRYMVECEFLNLTDITNADKSFNRYMVECEFCFKFSRIWIGHTRFNRYMVECEFFVYILSFAYNCVLIDTWWNVNPIIIELVPSSDNVLIDTWWNVNYN